MVQYVGGYGTTVGMVVLGTAVGVLQIGMELDRWLANHRPHLTYAPVHWYSTVVQHSDTVEWYRTAVQFTRDGGVLSQVPQPLFLVVFGQLGNLSGGYMVGN